ncbi:hypothetical protein PEPS_02680 [Persicobacter psychrovividus]|uniref:Uncharacterized protein n=1 Tax=Persicobacter psychrovividus TaxID=387638 RepID=A0ABN6L8L3_9BACT|nr:hypothetical protein PEPS_02680 [Persicobacter psychrovividus]
MIHFIKKNSFLSVQGFNTEMKLLYLLALKLIKGFFIL